MWNPHQFSQARGAATHRCPRSPVVPFGSEPRVARDDTACVRVSVHSHRQAFPMVAIHNRSPLPLLVRHGWPGKTIFPDDRIVPGYSIRQIGHVHLVLPTLRQTSS